MANSSDEYWMIDGVSLSQYGWAVTTVGGARYDLPPPRGENVTVAYTPGQRFRPKMPDQRTITLVMWVTGTDPATGNAVPDQRLRWNDSWDFLRRLVWRDTGAQLTLTRQWFLTVAGTPTLVSADASAEVADSMSPSMTGRHRADFTMNLLLADPFFYGAEIDTALPVGTPTVVTNPGHATAGPTGNLWIDLVGPLSNPTLTNNTPNPAVAVSYTGSVPAGETLTLDVGAYAATWTPPLASASADLVPTLNNLSYRGSRFWMVLIGATATTPGTNTLTLSADSGTGHAVLRFRPPYV